MKYLENFYHPIKVSQISMDPILMVLVVMALVAPVRRAAMTSVKGNTSIIPQRVICSPAQAIRILKPQAFTQERLVIFEVEAAFFLGHIHL